MKLDDPPQAAATPEETKQPSQAELVAAEELRLRQCAKAYAIKRSACYLLFTKQRCAETSVGIGVCFHSIR